MTLCHSCVILYDKASYLSTFKFILLLMFLIATSWFTYIKLLYFTCFNFYSFITLYYLYDLLVLLDIKFKSQTIWNIRCVHHKSRSTNNMDPGPQITYKTRTTTNNIEWQRTITDHNAQNRANNDLKQLTILPET